ncbi:phosphoglucosamine mutase [Thermotomaculum hydrothermale]|uniref:Phosphoglucosamine mutase n=1 Tax=Thermotomaculum hydrothermale TaxID=981385 RepID=A0A7R6PHD9_9BACT|nr:hypothetical protein [Thermotomaculum hydrothermale]BBB32634.1 phosphoglucosamine mutase [Thermotomaculum hydrothermale]
MKKIFGTDGIRGKAGEFPITPENIYKLGYLFVKITGYKNIAIGWDTRESSLWIANSLISGIENAGGKPVNLGCIPTPVLSFCTSDSFDGGVMITASHNPYTDNGIKFFNYKGEKISDEVENEITKEFYNFLGEIKLSEKIKNILFIEEKIVKTYLSHIKNKIDLSKIIKTYPVDCANGATSLFIELAQKTLNIKLNPYNTNPDGKNINLKCGAAQPDFIKKESFAFDGDGDRIMGKDLNGNIINGDIILMFLADKLNLDKLVGTVMTNMAVESFCKERKIEFYRTKVGDRFVKEKMNETNAKLGGETSGHIILTDLNSTGDSFAVYLKILELLNTFKIDINDLTKKYRLFPQKVINIPVKEKKPFEQIKGFKKLMEKCEIILGDKGRIFPRYSGTENLLRILIECQAEDRVNEAQKIIKNFFK